MCSVASHREWPKNSDGPDESDLDTIDSDDSDGSDDPDNPAAASPEKLQGDSSGAQSLIPSADRRATLRMRLTHRMNLIGVEVSEEGAVLGTEPERSKPLRVDLHVQILTS